MSKRIRKQPQVKVFMLDDDNSRGQRLAMDYFYTVDKSHADELTQAGKAVLFKGIPELDRYDREISNEVGRFRKEYEKIANSLDPRYEDEEFFAHEVAKLKAELDEKVKQLQTEYEDVIRVTRHGAQADRANLSRTVTEADERGATQLMNELVGIAKLDGIDKAIERIENDTQYYSDGRKYAIANELHRLVDILSEDDRANRRRLRKLVNTLRQDTEGVELAARMAKAMPDYTGTAYRTLKLTHRAYKR